MDLVDIKSEARRLERPGQPLTADKNAGGDRATEIGYELSDLKNKVDRGAISQEEYRQKKQILLEKFSDN